MNFKFTFLSILIVLYIIGCGVKSDPVLPKGSAIPSYVNKFLDSAESQEEDKKEVKKNSTEKRKDE